MPSSKPPLWLVKAFTYLNIDEKPGPASNPEIVAFYQDAGAPTIKDDATPWCAAFVGAILERSNIQSTKSLLARSYLKWGIPLDEPKTGAIAVFKRGTSTTNGHVGFVISHNNQEIFILGGNQSDAVNITPYNKSQLLGLRWPTIKPDWSENFKSAMSLVLQLEGGWSNHPQDPGGATNKGITLKTYQYAIQKNLITPPNKKLIEGLKTIGEDEVNTIYHRLYWQKAGCEHLAKPLSLMHFDAAVNHGVAQALKFLQEAVGATIDGEWGPETKAKTKTANQSQTIASYRNIRRNHYLTRPHFPTFGKGWLKRLTTIYQAAEKHVPASHPSIKYKETKPMTNTQPTDKQKWWAESLTIWGTIVTALSTILPILGPFIGLDISAQMIEQFGKTVAELIQLIGGLSGTSMALYGRLRAGSKLTRRNLSLRV